MRTTVKAPRTPAQIALATRIVYAVQARTAAGRPLVGQLAVADAVGIYGSAHAQRRKVSAVIELCYEMVDILYPGRDWVFNRNGRNVYTVGVPTIFEQLQVAYEAIYTADTKLTKAIHGLRATHDADAAQVATIANSARGVFRINEETLTEILARHTPAT